MGRSLVLREEPFFTKTTLWSPPPRGRYKPLARSWRLILREKRAAMLARQERFTDSKHNCEAEISTFQVQLWGTYTSCFTFCFSNIISWYTMMNAYGSNLIYKYNRWSLCIWQMNAYFCWQLFWTLKGGLLHSCYFYLNKNFEYFSVFTFISDNRIHLKPGEEITA